MYTKVADSQKLNLAKWWGSPEVNPSSSSRRSYILHIFLHCLQGHQGLLGYFKRKKQENRQQKYARTYGKYRFTSSGNYIYMYIYMRWLSLGFVCSNNQRFSIVFKLILCFDLYLIKESSNIIRRWIPGSAESVKIPQPTTFAALIFCEN